nr:uncharacterized protein LOC128672629 [Plodia interpunctella]XP_053605871.1 uncharacterized protein LOC128672629 [Plodia interpunctella]
MSPLSLLMLACAIGVLISPCHSWNKAQCQRFLSGRSLRTDGEKAEPGKDENKGDDHKKNGHKENGHNGNGHKENGHNGNGDKDKGHNGNGDGEKDKEKKEEDKKTKEQCIKIVFGEPPEDYKPPGGVPSPGLVPITYYWYPYYWYPYYWYPYYWYWG